MLNPKTEKAYTLFHEGILALARAEQAGIRVDNSYVSEQFGLIQQRIKDAESLFIDTNFYKHWNHVQKGKVNINSDYQLRSFIYGTKKIKPTKLTPSGQGAVDEETLLKLGIPELEQIIEMRRLKKMSDYLDNFSREAIDGYLHPNFSLHNVVSFRSASQNPNFQNIPIRDEEAMKIVRGALFPRPGHLLLEADFKGIEVAVAGCYTKDQQLIHDITRGDLHGDMAKQIFILDTLDTKNNKAHDTLRKATKNGFVFPQFYGDYYVDCTKILCDWVKLPEGKWTTAMGIPLDTPSFTISDHLISKGINSYKSFENHLKTVEDDFWGNRFMEYNEWKKRWWTLYQKYGYIDSLTGFRYNGVMDMKNCINYPIQGSAFHCLLWTFIEVDKVMREENWDSRLIGQIHDSLIMDVHPDELDHVTKTIQNITTVRLPDTWKWIIVPLEIEISTCPVDGSWAEKN